MSAPLHIPAGERGQIRVFAINRPPGDMATALASTPKPDLARELLGAPHLDTTSTEIFPVSDLAGVGLAAYLAEGYAVPDDALAADRARLDALEGYVLLFFSDSLAGSDVTLTPGDALTLIGTYAEPRPKPVSGPPLDADSAKPYSGAPQMTPPTPVRGRPGSVMVVAAIIVLLGLGLWALFT
ncbi:hypothetical protein [uncultured Roseobacter sp.]|uniref:hypothetical protein n=1 Tax=uncultured Roseobacter sp. TaxID=114847 RepID=UPI002605E84B|nr:hypothetical protein [uncultured Roseobacter sp.]